MTDCGVAESTVEQAALAWQNANNRDLALGELRVKDAERLVERAV